MDSVAGIIMAPPIPMLARAASPGAAEHCWLKGQ